MLEICLFLIILCSFIWIYICACVRCDHYIKKINILYLVVAIVWFIKCEI